MNITTSSLGWHLIQVDDDVFKELQRHAVPLVDDANTVLRKILGFKDTEAGQAKSEDFGPAGQSSQSSAKSRSPAGAKARQRSQPRKATKTKTDRAPKGSLVPESAYELPLLSALDELGGSAPASTVMDRVGELLGDRLTPLDRELVDSGKTRWRNRIQFVRLAMIRAGYMKDDSPRGIWEITRTGQTRINELKEADNAVK